MRNQAEIDATQDRVDALCDEYPSNQILSAIQDVLMWVREPDQPESVLMDHLNSQIKYEHSERNVDRILYQEQ